MDDGPNILVIRPGALGDTVFTEPVVASLRARHPDAHIEIAGRMDFLPLLVGPGLADACSSTDAARFTSLFAAGPVQLAGYDIIIAYLPDEDGSLAAKVCGAACTAVVFDPRPPGDGSVHIIDHLLKALEPLGVPAARNQPRLPRRDEWLRQAAALDPVLRRSGEYVVIHPGSGGRHKLLSAEKWADVIAGLRPRPVVLTCGPADETVVDDVLACVDGERPLVVRNQPVTTLAGVLAGAERYFGCDSGVTHLAAALGVPAAAVFGPTDPRTWAPRGPDVRVVDAGEGWRGVQMADILRVR
ncbi:MAG: glycosyltransferase family 9 protein [Planctomycetota bacterium]